MIATIRADFYRLFRTKGFWFAQLFIIGFIFISIAGQSVANIGVDVSENVTQAQSRSNIEWTGVTSVQAITSMMDIFLYAMLPMLVIIIGHDFTKKTYKNILTVGVSRTKYFFSQYISFAFMILLQIFYIYFVSFATGTLFYGVGAGFNNQQLLDWIFTASIQFLMVMAIMTVACLVTYLTKNNVLAILSAIFFPVIMTVLSFVLQNIEWLTWFDFQGVLTNTELILSGTTEIHQSIMTALATIFVLISVTIWQFNKSEL